MVIQRTRTFFTMLAIGLALTACDRNGRPATGEVAETRASAVGSESYEAEVMAAPGGVAIPGAEGVEGDPTARPVPPLGTKIELSEEEWKKILTDEQFHVLREDGTERAFTGPLLKIKEPGTFHCAGCNAPLFKTETKFESGTGWPSFHTPIEGRVGEEPDNRYGMVRTEVVCAACGGHQGHIFNDGPEPTGLRYCINSVSMNFRPASLPEPPEGIAPELNSTK